MSLKVQITNGVQSLKEGDTQTEIKMLLIEGNGTIFDLSGSTAKFVVSSRIGKLFEKPVVTTDKLGEVVFSFEPGEVTGSGQMFLEIHVTEDFKTKIFPSSDYLVVSIDKSLNIIGQTITSLEFERLALVVGEDIGFQVDELNSRVDDLISEVKTDLRTEVIDSAKIEWLSPVDTFSDFDTVYPSASEGQTAQTLDDNKTYRFDGENWEFIQQFGVGPFDDVYSEIDKIKENNNDLLLFSFFKSPTDLSNTLHLSSDGETLARLNASSSKLNNQRDPSIAYYKGRFYITHTGYNPHDFVISYSEDLVTWTTQNINIGLGGSTTVRIWAPEIFIDGDDFYILLSKQVGTENDVYGASIPSFRPYITKLLNPSTLQFEAPVALSLEASNKIDPCAIKYSGEYYIFIKDEFDKKIEIWKSSTLTGIYSKVSDSIVTLQETEGPSIVFYQNKFYLYVDAYKNDRGITYFSTSTDLTTWTDKKALKTKERVRHGSAFVVSDSKAKQTILKYRSSNVLGTSSTQDIYVPLSSLAVSNVVTDLDIVDNTVYTVSGSEQMTIASFKNSSNAKKFYLHIASNSDASITIANGSSIVGVVANTKWDAKYGDGDTLVEFEFIEALNNFKPKMNSLKKYTDKLNLGARLGWKRIDFATIGLNQSNLAVEDGAVYVLTGSADATLSGVQSLPDGAHFGVAVNSGVAKLTITSGTNILVPGGSFIVGATNNNNDTIIEFVKLSSSTFRLRK